MKNMLFLINPVSGKQLLSDCLMQVAEIFSRADYRVTIHFTKSSEDMRAAAEEGANSFDTIVCCGGDGTLNIVAGAVYAAGGKALIGYIPGGTTNDFANSRKIITYATGAAEQIAGGTVREFDLGLINGKPFVYVAAFGIFSDVSYQTSRESKQNFGHAAYVFEGIKSLANAKPYKMTVTWEDGEIEGDFIYGMVSNSKRIGGFEMPIMQNVLYDDGEMEALFVRKPENPVQTQRLLNALITQTPDNKTVYMLKTSHLQYSCDTEVPWSLDGEFGGAFKEAQVEVKGSAVKMVF